VRIRTTVPCAQLNGVAINAGSDPAAVEERVKLGFTDATTDKSQCDAQGEIGTVYLLPGRARASLVVRAGYGTQKATECTADNGYKGCIVARRSISYLDRTTLSITIELDPDCLDVPCGLLSTCSKGQCVSSEAVCKGNECNPDPAARVPGDERPGTDAGGVDGGGTSDGGEEAGTGTDSGQSEAGPLIADSGFDAPAETGTDGGTVGPDGSTPPVDAGLDGALPLGAGSPRCVFKDDGKPRAKSNLTCFEGLRCCGSVDVNACSSLDNCDPQGQLLLECTLPSECPANKTCKLNGMPDGDGILRLPSGPPLRTICMGNPALDGVFDVCNPDLGCTGGRNCTPVPGGPNGKVILYACQP